MDNGGIWKQVQEEFACEHEQTEVRRRTQSNGRTVFVQQCLRCGANRGAVKKDSISYIAGLKANEWDEDLRQRFDAARAGRLDELRASQNQAWWAWYNRYLQTPEWKTRRQLVLLRAGHVCEGCRREKAVQVHHKEYGRVGKEMLFDLVAVCEDCHAKLHPEDDSE